MRLKSIKLAGFKSFVDPTTVPFPTNLSAIVGPNGCGKSNIIDAVRWVMGESSAKHLRGESMTDVIFNGSSQRKPVGQASIELIFDNSDGKLVGEYASFNEISVKRRVTRDGGSDYFLNGAKCRRRDITDLFLGTGLGPRSYAIIEQGMITRLIESKPEELRVYIEEAAGISKYKERRRETENRIRRTRENIERLTDITEELDRQLAHLQRQARTAERYKILREEERFRKNQLSALIWSRLGQQQDGLQEKILEMEALLERYVTDRASNDSQIDTLREEARAISDQFERAQAQYYETGALISRIEQTIRHEQEKLQNRLKSIDEYRQRQEELRIEREEEQAQLVLWNEELDELEPSLEESLMQAEEFGEQLSEAEASLQNWQARWETFNHDFSGQKNQAELGQARIQQLESEIHRVRLRIERISAEADQLRGQLDTTSVDLQSSELETLLDDIETLTQDKDECERALGTLIEEESRLVEELNIVRSDSQVLQGKLGSLNALQEAVLGMDDSARSEVMRNAGLNEESLIISGLSVEPGWEQAVETVLKPFMQAVCVDDLARYAGYPLAMLEMTGPETLAVDDSWASEFRPLTELVRGVAGIEVLIGHVAVAEDVPEALGLRDGLKAWQWLVCKDGTLVGKNWIRPNNPDDPQQGAIQRLSEIESCEARLGVCLDRCEALEKELAANREAQRKLSEKKTHVSQLVADAISRKHALQSRIDVTRVRNEQIEQRIAAGQQEQETLREEVELLDEQLLEARDAWQVAMEKSVDLADQREKLLDERDRVRSRYDEVKQKARQAKDVAHQLQLQIQGIQSRKSALSQSVERLAQEYERVGEKLALLLASDDEEAGTLEEMKAELEILLEKKLDDEERLALIRRSKEKTDEQVRLAEQGRLSIEQKIQTLRNELQELRLEAQSVVIRRNGYRDELRESGVDIESIVQTLEEGVDEVRLEKEIEALAAKIQRLGAINLAAIEEYKVQSERKAYLQEQMDDLNEALETLESAIRKIDRETRARFKETFDTVNQGLQNLFPKVFGGGAAYLDLTGDDLLETGVTIMARPPGKKNSTIHLLSGGEKALTAISLIFSIFQLNPAPFCMLDEVDAPLDDANVGRYANLVREMASSVQFIYITHNKIAMEMADQLMGVTMHEPGVSRLVTVDIEEAAALAVA